MGSLLRPPELKEARAAHDAGQLTREELRAVEDRTILDALALQRAVGLGVFTDSEYRRYSFMSDMADAVEGFVPDTVGTEWRGPGGGQSLGGLARVVGGRDREVGLR